MMNELKKVFFNRNVFLFCILSIAVMFAFSFHYKNKTITANDYFSHSIRKYNEFSEIITYKNELMRNINELDTNDKHYKDDLRMMNETISIYDYLYEHKVKYDEIAEVSAFSIYNNDSVSFFLELNNIILLLTVIFILYIIWNTFTQDFSNGTYKFIYGRSKSRLYILRNKLFVSSILIFLLFILLLIMGLVFMAPYTESFNKIFFLSHTKVICLSKETFILFLVLSTFEVLLFYFLIFSIVGIYMKDGLKTLIIQIPTLLIIQNISVYIDWDILYALSQFPILISLVDIDIHLFIMVTVIKFLLLGVLLYIMIHKFKKQDLLF